VKPLYLIGWLTDERGAFEKLNKANLISYVRIQNYYIVGRHGTNRRTLKGILAKYVREV